VGVKAKLQCKLRSVQHIIFNLPLASLQSVSSGSSKAKEVKTEASVTRPQAMGFSWPMRFGRMKRDRGLLLIWIVATVSAGETAVTVNGDPTRTDVARSPNSITDSYEQKDAIFCSGRRETSDHAHQTPNSRELGYSNV
jgi:hypothetical protein